VSAPALLGSVSTAKIFATRPAQISALHVTEGTYLQSGEPVLTLHDPALVHERDQVIYELNTLIQRQTTETQWLASHSVPLVSEDEITAKRAALLEVETKIESLELLSPVDSIVTTIPSWVKEGVWVNTNTELVALASSQSLEVRAYIPSAELQRIEKGPVYFYTHRGGEPIKLDLVFMDDSNIDVLEDRALAVTYGGDMAVSQSADGHLRPLKGWTMAILRPVSSALHISTERSGYVMLPAKEKSLMSSVVDRLYGVLIRESGF